MELGGWVVWPKPHPLLSPAVDFLKRHITLQRITHHEAQEKKMGYDHAVTSHLTPSPSTPPAPHNS